MVYVRYVLINRFNVRHLNKHNVTLQEALEVCDGEHITDKSYGGRYLIVGQSKKHRLLTVILAPKPEAGTDIYYPVSARPASRKERRAYNKQFKTKEVKHQ